MAIPVPERDPSVDAPRRIAFVITRSDAVGGAQFHVLEVAAGLHRAGHTVTVFVGGDGDFHDLLAAVDVPTHRLRWLRRDPDLIADALAPVELFQALRAFQPDLISCHTSKAGVFGRLVSRLLRIPNVMIAHGWLLTPGALTSRQKLIRTAERLAGRITDHLIGVSQHDQEIAVEHGILTPEKMSVVYNAIPDVDSRLRATHEGEAPRLIMISRLLEPKDPFTLLRALAPMRASAWHLDLVWDGPLRPRVEAEIRDLDLEDRVTLHGEQRDIAARLARADIFILSSKREGFPLSVLEAMRAGLPVVASDVGGISEAVIDGETGLLAVSEDPDALREALRALMDDPARRRALGQRGRRRFEQDFALDRHIRRTWAVYHAVITGAQTE